MSPPVFFHFLRVSQVRLAGRQGVDESRIEPFTAGGVGLGGDVARHHARRMPTCVVSRTIHDVKKIFSRLFLALSANLGLVEREQPCSNRNRGDQQMNSTERLACALIPPLRQPQTETADR